MSLKALLTRILNVFKLETGVLTAETGWTLGTGSFVRKRCGVVEAYIILTGGTYTSGWNTVATLPAYFRPINYYDAPFIDNADDTMAHGRVNADGTVQVYKTTNLHNNLRIRIEFLVGGTL